MPASFLPSIRFIYFDFDNVLATRTENRSQLVASMLGLTDSARLREFYFVSFHKDAQLEDRYLHLQTIDEEIAFYRDLFRIFAESEGMKPAEEQLLAAARAFVHVPLQVQGEVFASLKRLQGKYELGIFSNGLPSRRQEVVSTGLQPYFTRVIISCDYGVEKPARAIYDRAVAAAGMPANAIALVDDEPANVRAAAAAGFGQAILFTPAFWQQALSIVK